MVKNCIKKPLFWNRFSHSSDLASFFSEHCHPLGLGYLKTPLISEHCHPKSKCINLFIFLFRSIATHYRFAIAFRSVSIRLSTFCTILKREKSIGSFQLIPDLYYIEILHQCVGNSSVNFWIKCPWI